MDLRRTSTQALPGKNAAGQPMKTPYNLPNRIMTPEAQHRNIVAGIAYQGYTFNIPNGASIQNLQIPGDCTEILGHCASWDNVTFAGFNNTLALAINNLSIFNAVNIAFLNINRFLVSPGYVPLNKLVSPTSILNLTFANGTGVLLTNFNYIIVYR